MAKELWREIRKGAPVVLAAGPVKVEVLTRAAHRARQHVPRGLEALHLVDEPPSGLKRCRGALRGHRRARHVTGACRDE